MTTRPIRLFIVHAVQDEAYLHELEKHLSTLQRLRTIEIWNKRRLAAGDDVALQIDAHLEQADIIIFAVSADFLASDDIHDVQVARSLQRHADGSARVIPIILRSTNWQSTSFGHLSPLPRGGKAVDTWQNQDEAWLDIVTGIGHVVNESSQGLTLAANNASLTRDLASAQMRERALVLRCDALEGEVADLRDTHRQFDVELSKASSELRAELRSARAQVADLTTLLGQKHSELEFHQGQITQVASQRSQHLAQINRLNEELKQSTPNIEFLGWKSESYLYILSGGVDLDGSKPFVVNWSFAVENIGNKAVRLIEGHVTWCIIDAEDSSAVPLALQQAPDILVFDSRPVLEPGSVSEVYALKVNTKNLDAEHAKELRTMIRPRLRIFYAGVRNSHKATAERLLELENKLP